MIDADDYTSTDYDAGSPDAGANTRAVWTPTDANADGTVTVDGIDDALTNGLGAEEESNPTPDELGDAPRKGDESGRTWDIDDLPDPDPDYVDPDPEPAVDGDDYDPSNPGLLPTLENVPRRRRREIENGDERTTDEPDGGYWLTDGADPTPWIRWEHLTRLDKGVWDWSEYDRHPLQGEFYSHLTDTILCQLDVPRSVRRRASGQTVTTDASPWSNYGGTTALAISYALVDLYGVDGDPEDVSEEWRDRITDMLADTWQSWAHIDRYLEFTFDRLGTS